MAENLSRQERQEAQHIEAIRAHSPEIADNNLGVLTGATLVDNQTTKSNIIFNIIGFIIGLFTGHRVMRTSDTNSGTVLIGEDGLHYFEMKGKNENAQVDAYLFFPYGQINRAVKGRSIVFTKELRVHGTHVSASGKATGYRLELMYFKEDIASIDTIASKLASKNVNVTAGKRLKAFVALAVIAVVAWGAWAVAVDGWLPFAQAPAIIEGDSYTSRNFAVHFVSAHTHVEHVQGGQNLVVVYFDYHAIRNHTSDRPFRLFTMYQGDTALDFWDGGLRVSASERGMVRNGERFNAGEVFYARAAVVPVNDTDPIRIVRYDNRGNVVFTYHLPIS